MASFRKRSGRWQARITRKGHRDLTRTFVSKADAQRWARLMERDLDAGSFNAHPTDTTLTVSVLIERYRREVVPNLRGASTEHIRLNTICRFLGHHNLKGLTASAVADYRDQRLKTVSPSTCLRELQTLSAMLTVAEKDWQVISANPVSTVRKPSPNRARQRRLDPAEEERLMLVLTPSQRLNNGQWSKGIRNVWMKPFVKLAIETAMRRGELLSMRWDNVNLGKRTVYLPMTKNGYARHVPLSLAATQVLKELPRSIDGRVFPLTPNAVRQAWSRACLTAGLNDLHLHDLRHEATSRLAERLNVLELAAITGHRDLRMLSRYTHPRAEALAVKIG